MPMLGVQKRRPPPRSDGRRQTYAFALPRFRAIGAKLLHLLTSRTQLLAGLDDALSHSGFSSSAPGTRVIGLLVTDVAVRSEEHTSELQSRGHLVCRLLL